MVLEGEEGMSEFKRVSTRKAKRNGGWGFLKCDMHDFEARQGAGEKVIEFA